MGKNELLRLFGVDDKKTYINNTARFRETVLNVAADEVNKHTEYEVWFVPVKEGRSITGFTIHWSTGQNEVAASAEQVATITTMVEAVEEDVWKFLELVEDMETEELAMMRKVKNILACGKELTSQTTNTEAKKILQNLRVFIADLHNQVRRLINTQAIKEEDVVPFYNWLEERD